jgi:hypothetical protein
VGLLVDLLKYVVRIIAAGTDKEKKENDKT